MRIPERNGMPKLVICSRSTNVRTSNNNWHNNCFSVYIQNTVITIPDLESSNITINGVISHFISYIENIFKKKRIRTINNCIISSFILKIICTKRNMYPEKISHRYNKKSLLHLRFISLELFLFWKYEELFF